MYLILVSIVLQGGSGDGLLQQLAQAQQGDVRGVLAQLRLQRNSGMLDVSLRPGNVVLKERMCNVNYIVMFHKHTCMTSV